MRRALDRANSASHGRRPCCASTFRKALTSPSTHATTSTLSAAPSTVVLARPWAGGHQPKLSTITYAPSSLAPLRRLLEPAQYTSVAFGQRCKQAGVQPSMGPVGDAYDNAMCESFFASLECELLDRRVFRSHAEGRMAVFQYIEGWYNPRRRHSALGYQSPVNYERMHPTAA